eukprot:COSAG01_NODE_35596_length_529_cov_5.983721_1_plen_131_part_01
MTSVCVVVLYELVRILCLCISQHCSRAHLEPVRAHALHGRGHHRGGVNNERASNDEGGCAGALGGDTLARSGVPPRATWRAGLRALIAPLAHAIAHHAGWLATDLGARRAAALHGLAAARLACYARRGRRG